MTSRRIEVPVAEPDRHGASRLARGLEVSALVTGRHTEHHGCVVFPRAVCGRQAGRRAPASVLGRRSPTIAGWSGLLAGVGWLLLVPASELVRRDLLSYDAYNRALAAPLLLLMVAVLLAPGVLSVREGSGATGLRIAAAGGGLLCVGNAIEFYGVLLQDGLNAQAAHEAGVGEPWVGSDVGWIVFGLGMVVVSAGGLLTAASLLRDPTRPRRLALLAAVLGVGILAVNLFGLAPAFLSVPVLGLYAGGWLLFGRLLLTGGHATHGGRDVVPASRARTASTQDGTLPSPGRRAPRRRWWPSPP